MCSFSIIHLFIFITWKAGQQTNREREKKISFRHWSIPPLPAPGVARPGKSQKPETSFSSHYKGGTDLSLWTIICCFLEALAGRWIRSSMTGTKISTLNVWCSYALQRLNLLLHNGYPFNDHIIPKLHRS